MLTYLGQERTPSSESLDSGGFLTILIPNFSVSVAEEAIITFSCDDEYERGRLALAFDPLNIGREVFLESQLKKQSGACLVAGFGPP